MKSKLSIVDIARELNLSTTTISFVLNGKSEEKRISQQVTNDVLAFVNKVGYKPNSLAQNLRTGKSNIIGLMIEDIANPFFANIARKIEEKAYDSGYKIIYCSTDNDLHKTRELIRMFKDRYVDGYIMTPPPGIEPEIKLLLNAGLPVVLFDRYLPDITTDYVIIDNELSCYAATLHLIERGCRNIVFITLESDQTQMQERINGYKKALVEHNGQVHINRVPFHEDPALMVNEMIGFIKSHDKIDAILFATNYLAINGLKAIYAAGKKIPDDIAIVVFDDHELFELYKPSISVIAQPMSDIAEQVISMLLDKLNNNVKVTDNMFKILPAKLIIRNSSKIGEFF